MAAGKDLPAGRIYQLEDGDSYTGWLVEWQLYIVRLITNLQIG